MLRTAGVTGRFLLAMGWVCLLAAAPVAAQEMEELPPTAHLRIYEPQNYAELTGPVRFRVEAVEMEARKAGTLAPRSGHFHFLVNLPAMDRGQVIPDDETHLHWDDGRTDGTIALPPGLYSITVQFADGLHRSFGPRMAQTVVIRVKK